MKFNVWTIYPDGSRYLADICDTRREAEISVQMIELDPIHKRSGAVHEIKESKKEEV